MWQAFLLKKIFFRNWPVALFIKFISFCWVIPALKLVFKISIHTMCDNLEISFFMQGDTE